MLLMFLIMFYDRHISQRIGCIFSSCNFSITIWNYLQIQWEGGHSFKQVFVQARSRFNKTFFVEVVILASWHIWKQRNEAIFQNVMPSFRSRKRGFIYDITLQYA